ncbi:MAG: hypothetical protein Q9O62_04935 [Ardenticatenia bacterium]|nr:hypothetical protein [Ardenticatenia bacterium]
MGVRSQVFVEGTWQLEGQQLQAERLTITRAKLPFLLRTTAPPANTVGYVVRRTPFRPADVLAIGANTTATPILELEQAIEIRAAAREDGALDFVITFFMPGCDRYWVVVYSPRQGIVAKWLAERPSTDTGFFHTIWRPESGDMFFLVGTPANGTWQYRLYRADRSRLTAEPGARLRPGLLPLGWSTFSEELVAFDMGASRPTLVLLEPSGEETRQIPLTATPSNIRLSPDGRRLAFTARFRRTEGPPDTLIVLDVADGSQQVLWSSAIGEGLGTPVWAQATTPVKVAVPVGPLQGEGKQRTFASLYTFTFGDEGRPSPEVTLFSQLRELVGVALCPDERRMWAYRDQGQTILIHERVGERQVIPLAFTSAQVLGCE